LSKVMISRFEEGLEFNPFVGVGTIADDRKHAVYLIIRRCRFIGYYMVFISGATGINENPVDFFLKKVDDGCAVYRE
jgi:hypothetical protein